MSLIKAVFRGISGLILVASVPLFAEPGFSPLGDSQIPKDVLKGAAKVLELWTPGHTVPLAQESYAARRRSLEANLATGRYRDKINLAELSRCERRNSQVCYLSETVRRSSAFVLKGGVVQTVRRAFSWNESGLSETFSRLALQWQEEMKFPELQRQVSEAIKEFIANPMGDAVFLLIDKTGKVVFDSSEDQYTFLRYGTATSLTGTGRVELGRQYTSKKGKGSKAVNVTVNLPARVYILNDDLDLDSPKFGGLPWVANDFAQIKIEKELPFIETASIDECGPGAKIFSAGYPQASRGRAALGARDSIDRELSITRGRALTMEEFANGARDWEHLAKFLHGLRGRTYLVTDADGEAGMEGGPILTEDGKACGILKDTMRNSNRTVQLTIPF